MQDIRIKHNWLDRMLGFFSPETLRKRSIAKIHNSKIMRKYEGADKGRRTSGWITPGSSANTESAIAQTILRDRARDLVRNDSNGVAGIRIIQNNVVGPGITTQIKIGRDPEITPREKRINSIWKEWANSPAIDYEGINNIVDMQNLLMRSVAESGEIIVRLRRVERRFAFDEDGSKIELPPIALQLLESDFISRDRIRANVKNGNRVVQGIELDKRGRRVAYHLFKDHPGGNDIVSSSRFLTSRIPADTVAHLYRMDRAGQVRGMPWMAPVILKMRDLGIYEDAQLKRQQCAAMYVGFIHDIEGLDDVSEEEQKAELGETMEPGTMEILPPGKDITLSNPPGAENYGEYTGVVLRAIASGYGITYESLTGDYGNVNFSSARMGWLEMQRNLTTWRTNIIINQFMKRVFSWYMDSLELIGEASPETRAAKPIFTAPRREMIDPSKEIAAKKVAIRAGLTTLSEAIREQGRDPAAHFAEHKQDNNTVDNLELVFDTDSRKRDNAGKLIGDETNEIEENNNTD